MPDFTLSKYGTLLDALKNAKYDILTMREWIQAPRESFAVIRHDVDRKAGNSLKTAVLENEKGIRATYYFRMTKGSFRPDIIKGISGLGHEIGYHYEDLTRNGGDIKKALEDFGMNLGKLREHADISTIAMHGKPSSSADNLDMWKSADFRQFGICGEAYLTPDYSDIYYFSDTGRNWRRSSKANYKDYAGGLNHDGVSSTGELTEFIREKRPEKIVVMTHPERWSGSLSGYVFYLVRDNTINLAKTILRPFIGKR